MQSATGTSPYPSALLAITKAASWCLLNPPNLLRYFATPTMLVYAGSTSAESMSIFRA
ncbi:MAG: hypothetical protein KGI38_11275 [Thaumarchaeota archaeon]|nr:hypothetical protein [Nitrososphaerota archaeon]